MQSPLIAPVSLPHHVGARRAVLPCRAVSSISARPRVGISPASWAEAIAVSDTEKTKIRTLQQRARNDMHSWYPLRYRPQLHYLYAKMLNATVVAFAAFGWPLGNAGS